MLNRVPLASPVTTQKLNATSGLTDVAFFHALRLEIAISRSMAISLQHDRSWRQ
jgi:hypothetical protein